MRALSISFRYAELYFSVSFAFDIIRSLFNCNAHGRIFNNFVGKRTIGCSLNNFSRFNISITCHLMVEYSKLCEHMQMQMQAMHSEEWKNGKHKICNYTFKFSSELFQKHNSIKCLTG